MTEHELEQIEQLFPQGFLIIVPDQFDSQHLRMGVVRPDTNPGLVLLLRVIQEYIKEIRTESGEFDD